MIFVSLDVLFVVRKIQGLLENPMLRTGIHFLAVSSAVVAVVECLLSLLPSCLTSGGNLVEIPAQVLALQMRRTEKIFPVLLRTGGGQHENLT